MSKPDPSRRALIKRAAYVAPAVLTFAAAPDFAKAGSVKSSDIGGGKQDRGGGWGWGKDKPKNNPKSG
jgi:hypothetical protein